MRELIRGVATAFRVRRLARQFGPIAGRAVAADRCPNCGGPGGYCGPVCSDLISPEPGSPPVTETVHFSGPDGKQHAVIFADLNTEVDWECSCDLISGRENRTREDAEFDVVLTHQQQDGIAIAPNAGDR